jgi:broad specificity phosphatase PhoE
MDNLPQLQNKYFVLRHGKSEANEQEIILSDPEEGIIRCGLTEEGKEQVRKSVQEAKEKGVLDKATIIYSSDFVRCRETSEITKNILECDTIHLDKALRERNFGEWEKTHQSNYQKIWNIDSINSKHRMYGVENVYDVLNRITSLILELEAKYKGECILLVSHGDALQILQTAFERVSPTKHRQLPHLQTAEIRELQLKL